MKNDWDERPLDYRNLLNPAFCGVILTKAAKDYGDLAGHGMPLSLMFLLLPLSMPAYIRDILPTNSASSLPAWVHEHPEVRVGLAEHARDLVDITRQSLLFCIQRRALVVSPEQLVSSVPRRLGASESLEQSSARIEEIVKRAKFIGRWFARSGEPGTIYFLLGLRP